MSHDVIPMTSTSLNLSALSFGSNKSSNSITNTTPRRNKFTFSASHRRNKSNSSSSPSLQVINKLFEGGDNKAPQESFDLGKFNDLLTTQSVELSKELARSRESTARCAELLLQARNSADAKERLAQRAMADCKMWKDLAAAREDRAVEIHVESLDNSVKDDVWSRVTRGIWGQKAKIRAMKGYWRSAQRQCVTLRLENSQLKSQLLEYRKKDEETQAQCAMREAHKLYAETLSVDVDDLNTSLLRSFQGKLALA